MGRKSIILTVLALTAVLGCRASGKDADIVPGVVPGVAAAHDRHRTIVRTDTVTYTDTIVRRRTVARTDVIYRTETELGADTLNAAPGPVLGGISAAPRWEVTGSSVSVTEGTPVAVGAPAQDTAPVAEYVQASATAVEASAEPAPAPDGGRMLWIPDSLCGEVEDILNGRAVAAAAPGAIAVGNNEMTIFRGDTIPMVLHSRNLGRFDRGLSNHLFIPRGMWQLGVTAAYGEFSTSDLEILDLISDIDFSGHIFNIKPYFSYFVRDNMSVGLKLGYTSGKADIGSFNVDIDDDMNFNLHDICYRSESYSAALTFNQYFGMARRGRFGVFNEVELAFQSGNSDFIRPYGGELRTTHTTSMQVGLNFSPGVSVFVMKQVAFNVSFGVFGVSLRSDKQTVDGVDMGRRFSSGANFRFNIFNINLGIAVNV